MNPHKPTPLNAFIFLLIKLCLNSRREIVFAIILFKQPAMIDKTLGVGKCTINEANRVSRKNLYLSRAMTWLAIRYKNAEVKMCSIWYGHKKLRSCVQSCQTSKLHQIQFHHLWTTHFTLLYPLNDAEEGLLRFVPPQTVAYA